MTAEFKPYDSMKDSGVEWLGDVPAHWRVLPNRAVFREAKRSGHANERMLSVTISSGVIRQDDLLHDSSRKDQSQAEKSAYKLVQPGDLAYNKMRAWQGAIGVSKHKGIVSPAYVVQSPLKTSLTNSSYFHYLFRTPTFAKEAERSSYGITSDMWSLRSEDFRTIRVCVPPLPEQTDIARFLEHSTGRIERYIRAKEKLIALLEEQKQLVVHDAVTGRIDVRTGEPYSAYKPSAVEWLGDVPAHWDVRRLRNVGKALIGLTYDPGNVVERGEGLLVFRASNIHGGKIIDADNVYVRCQVPERLLTRDGDILLCSRSGSRALVGKNAMIDAKRAGVTFGAFMTVFRSASNEFLKFVFNSALFERQSGAFLTSTINQLTLSMLYSIRVPFPPPGEQSIIVRYLEDTISKVTRAINRKNREIKLLREYRTRLIADVVTGKLDVRETGTVLA